MSEILATDNSNKSGRNDQKKPSEKAQNSKNRLSVMGVVDLKTELLDLHRALCSARLQLSMGQMKDVSQFSKLRKDIARVNLLLSSKKKMEMTNG